MHAEGEEPPIHKASLLTTKLTCTNIEQFHEYSFKMQNGFLQRGYPTRLVKDVVERVGSSNRLELLQAKQSREVFKG